MDGVEQIKKHTGIDVFERLFNDFEGKWVPKSPSRSGVSEKWVGINKKNLPGVNKIDFYAPNPDGMTLLSATVPLRHECGVLQCPSGFKDQMAMEL